ncbi:PREDICTED: carboxypeptidase N subunit 2-like [Branchiostoma belcheri]|uniref:Carboxypeptidase N subunit 2-like n=1 Tax=Branchiostoma belcheri TaxID=7741 RepID=A0A6P4YFW5_BRABE|nr:PREDICTED: carboxypeptidase N subunit 2-like [Branchiostoma belcheri]
MAAVSRVHVIFVLVCFVLFQAAEARCPDGCDCEPGIFPVDVTCTGEKILSIPQNIPIFTTSLTITNTGITEVRADDLKALKRLRTLLLPNNKISTIDAGAFDELSRLEFFDISGNVLDSFPSGLFKNCRLLKELNGASNHISSLPEDLLSGLAHIESLNLYDNNITVLSPNIFKDTSRLNSLDLSNNKITKISKTLFSNTRLNKIVLNDNMISTIDDGAFAGMETLGSIDIYLHNNQLTSVTNNTFKISERGGIETLTLHDNKIATLESGSLESADQMSELDLSYNMLAQVSLPGLRSIETVSLNSNKLKRPPAGLSDAAETLTTLDLYDNEMDEIPAGAFQGLRNLNRLNLANSLKVNGTLNAQAFCNLRSLESLVLDEDHLQSVPTDALNCITTLTSLTLSYNRIDNVTSDFGKSSNLLELYLKDNSISMVPINILMPYTNLVRIDMTSNSITHLSSNSFPNTKLATLVLEGNHISFIESGAFVGLSSLETVNLANNQASYLPGNIFSGFKNLSKVSLDNNPWACDCLMKDFARWLNMSDPMLEIEVECRSPSKYFGKKLRDLDVDELTCDDCKPQTSAPKIDQSGGQVQGTVGKDTVLTCNVTACPQAEIFWTIPQSPGVELSKYSTQYNKFQVNNLNGTLTVKNTIASDAGDYHCKAFNGLGSDSKVVKLTVM